MRTRLVSKVPALLLVTLVLGACGGSSGGARGGPGNGSDGGPGGDGSAVGQGDGGSGSCGAGLTACAGSCVATFADPQHCGACGRACGSGQVCLGSTCVAASSCPEPLKACGGSCVDVDSSNDHCGGCGNRCPVGQGCQSGSCVPGVMVGAAPGKCAGGGPPITFTDTPGGSCAGRQASATFKHALCSCSDVGVPIPLSSEALFDGYDSATGPYRPGGLGGGVGANGAVAMSSKFTVWGDLQSAGSGGVMVDGETAIHRDLQVAGPLRINSKLSVAGDAYVGGAITSASEGSIVGRLLTPTCAAAPGSLGRGSCVQGAVTVPPPCPCQPSELIPVAARIAHFADPARNDNAAIGLRADIYDAPGAAGRLDLPCGYYYLNQINASSPITIAVHGHTALFIGGSIEVSGALTFALDPTATLDVYVGGTVFATGTLKVGSPAYPARSRFYVGGAAKPAGASCRLDAECNSLDCGGAGCTGAGTDRPFAVNLTSNSQLNGLFYAPAGGFVASSKLDMYGALLVGHFQASSYTAIHYDRVTTRIGHEECPPLPPPRRENPPGQPVSDAGADGGSYPCTPRDEDGDGYSSCDCFQPVMSCMPNSSSRACAPDCCDRPGDPGCPAGLGTLVEAAGINPGRVDVNCDKIDNNCARESAGQVTGYVCSGGTQMCIIE